MKRIVLLLIIILLLAQTTACQQTAKPAVLPQQTVAPSQTPPPTSTATKPRPTATPDMNAPVWVSSPDEGMLLRIDPASNSIAASIAIDGRPDMVAAGEGAVWVLDRQHELVFRIDPATNQVTASIPLPAGHAETMAVGSGSVWVGMTGRISLSEQENPDQEEDILPPGIVVQIDAADNQIAGQYPAQPISRLALSDQVLWVLSRNTIDTPLQIFDLRNQQGMVVPFRNAPEWMPIEAVAVGSDSLWLISSAYGKIFRATLDGMVIAAVDMGLRQPTGYADLLMDASGLWAATPWGSVLHIDSSTDRLLGEVDLGTPLSGLVAGGGDVWAVSQQAGVVYRIDPASGSVIAQITTGIGLEPTVVPTPTPRVVIWHPCPDGPNSRLKVGDLAYVTKDPPIPNRVRKEPNREAEIVGHINPGASMEILEGPACSDGWVWWKIKNAEITGWTAEGDRETYWLVPLFN